MPRTKKYDEQEVIEKAMNLFWKKGYEMTSMQMLEKEMGINKFSIYSSFGNKNGVFLESLKCYKGKLDSLINKLKASSGGVHNLKQYFYDFIEFSKDHEFGRGCLVTNTANELGQIADEPIKNALTRFTTEVREVFADMLHTDLNKDSETVSEQADYLIIAMFGLSSATKVFSKSQLHHYIENTFKNI